MGRASGGSNMPHWIRNNIHDFLRAVSVKIAVENGKICNKTTMGDRLYRISDVWIVDETYSFRLDSVKRIEEHHPRHESSTTEKDGSREGHLKHSRKIQRPGL